jgi:hypothetical protein
MSSKTDTVPFTLELTPQEWDKLNALADNRTKMSGGKHTYTPEYCIRGFIATAVINGGDWENPSESASKYEAKKRMEAQAKEQR